MQKKKGISLIVLIITIIVMIILATAIILSLNNSGIINKANEAVEKTDLAQVKHLATLKWSEAYLDKKLTKREALYNYVIKELEKGVDISDYKIIVTEQGVDVYYSSVPNKWAENVIDIVDTVPIPKGFVASQATGENTKEKGLVIYEGTEAVTDANVETAKRTRNQYVWIPVANEDFTTKFVRQDFGMNHTLSNTLGTDYWEVVLDLTTNLPFSEQDANYIPSETLTEVQELYASVEEYEGFYIARYEAGIDTQRTSYLDESGNVILEPNVYSMMGKIPYNYIPWGENEALSEDTNGAVQIARSIYPITNTEYGVVSTLTYGVQWDTVLQWWLDTNALISVTESTAYGNYNNHLINSSAELNDGALVRKNQNTDEPYVAKDDDTIVYPKLSGVGWVLSTGALKTANINNIYDMAGNMWEWIMEGYGGTMRTLRGGFYGEPWNGLKFPVAWRHDNEDYKVYDSVGFRPSLYIKK